MGGGLIKSRQKCPGSFVGVDIGREEGVVGRIFADQIGTRGLVGPHVEAGASVLRKAVVDVMRGAGVIAGAERRHQVGVICDVIEAVESRCSTFIVSVVDEMPCAGLSLRPSLDQVAVAGEETQAIEVVLRPSRYPLSMKCAAPACVIGA